MKKKNTTKTINNFNNFPMTGDGTGFIPAIKKDGTVYYRASLTFRGKHISLGSFPTETEAHEAYVEGCRLLHPRLNGNRPLSIEDYTPANLLPFEKWVILCNYRDHNIYFGTPIYTGQKMFYYYLSQDLVLKFDTDDLFYYASHKIQQRGGHLFVADYGSQFSLGNRYGIKSYAVEGRDVCFINGDNTDYRRSNIEIKNPYQGVLPCEDGSYQARIHIRSYYIVGKYENALIAAIAYNKAVDLLRAQGIQKAFVMNDLSDISPRVFAELYTSIEVSDRIKNFSQ